MIKFAKVDVLTNIVTNVFDHDSEVLGEEFGNPVHYVRVPDDQDAIIGGEYDRENSIFLPPKPYASWTLDSNNQWQPPIPRPDDFDREHNKYYWNEETQTWSN